LLYIAVALVAVLALPLSELAGNTTPFATMYTAATGNAPTLIGLISLVAIINGVLVQIIMGSRILYGLSSTGKLPAFFGKISKTRRTPVNATFVVAAIVLALALFFPLITLAQAASFIILIVYALMNLSLIILKKKTPHPKGVSTYPMVIPVLGVIASSSFILFFLVTTFV